MPDIELTDELRTALEHYYRGLPASEAVARFFASCAESLISAHAAGDELEVPLRFTNYAFKQQRSA
jgi:hypothetical protein